VLLKSFTVAVTLHLRFTKANVLMISFVPCFPLCLVHLK